MQWNSLNNATVFAGKFLNHFNLEIFTNLKLQISLKPHKIFEINDWMCRSLKNKNKQISEVNTTGKGLENLTRCKNISLYRTAFKCTSLNCVVNQWPTFYEQSSGNMTQFLTEQ